MVRLYPNGKEENERDYLAFELQCISFNKNSLINYSNIYVKFIVILRNYKNYTNFKTESKLYNI